MGEVRILVHPNLNFVILILLTCWSLQCVADTGSFLDVAVDRDLWCTEIECKTRIVEEDIAVSSSP